MSKRFNETPPSVQRAATEVVLTMTPQRAQLLAASIWLGDADHTEWLDSLADSLSAASQESASLVVAAPPTDRSAADYSNVFAIGGAAAGVTQSLAAHTHPAPEVTGESSSVTAAALAEALALAADAQLNATDDFEALALVAARVTKAAAAAAATRKLQAAEAAQAKQAAGATKVALATAETVRQAARLVQLHADQDAEKVEDAAKEAALVVASAVLPGAEEVSIEKAATVAAVIRAIAVAKADDTARAASTVERAAATAATDAATHAADAADALRRQVAETAAAVHAVAEERVDRIASDALQRLGVLASAD